MSEACPHEAYPNPGEGSAVDGYVLVGFLCRKCGEWIKV